MKLYIDDGSTGSKVAVYNEKTGEIDLHIKSNSAEFGLGMTSESSAYTIDGLNLTFFPECDALATASIQYQYSDHAVCAVHHALHELGFSGQTLSVVVTLPISEFYKNGRVNSENVAKKKKNLLRKVTAESAAQITIENVEVYPEGIPAASSELIVDGEVQVSSDEFTFIADLGGVSLDLACFSGAAERIIKAASYNIGMMGTYSSIRNSVNKTVRDIQVRNLLETGEAAGGRLTVDRTEVTKDLINKVVSQILSFLGDDVDNISHCFLLGGGAELLSPALDKISMKHKVVKNPQTALVYAIAKIDRQNIEMIEALRAKEA